MDTNFCELNCDELKCDELKDINGGGFWEVAGRANTILGIGVAVADFAHGFYEGYKEG